MSGTGTVYKSTGSWYRVRSTQEIEYLCRTRGKFRIEGLETSNPIAVGDEVQFTLEKDGTGTIHHISPRHNYLIRKSSKHKGVYQILGVNLDRAVLVATVAQPRTSSGFIDRFLVSAEFFAIPAHIIFNKSDLWKPNSKEWNLQKKWAGLYRELGYTVWEVSALSGTGMPELQKELNTGRSLFCGHSGSGKSSILNRFIPDLELKTGAISGWNQKGTHTTTFSEMFDLGPLAQIIDSPGIRELDLIDAEPYEWAHQFPEMREPLTRCRFSTCLHINEPDCAVLQALEKGAIEESRYTTYVNLVTGKDNRA